MNIDDDVVLARDFIKSRFKSSYIDANTSNLEKFKSIKINGQSENFLIIYQELRRNKFNIWLKEAVNLTNSSPTVFTKNKDLIGKSEFHDLILKYIELLEFKDSSFKKFLKQIDEIGKQYFQNDEGRAVNRNSLNNLICISASERIRESNIAIESETGKFIIFYQSNNYLYESKKITLIVNEKNFTVSIISRKGGLLKFRGTLNMEFPKAFNKIDMLFEAFPDEYL